MYSSLAMLPYYHNQNGEHNAENIIDILKMQTSSITL